MHVHRVPEEHAHTQEEPQMQHCAHTLRSIHTSVEWNVGLPGILLLILYTLVFPSKVLCIVFWWNSVTVDCSASIWIAVCTVRASFMYKELLCVQVLNLMWGYLTKLYV